MGPFGAISSIAEWLRSRLQCFAKHEFWDIRQLQQSRWQQPDTIHASDTFTRGWTGPY